MYTFSNAKQILKKKVFTKIKFLKYQNILSTNQGVFRKLKFFICVIEPQSNLKI